MIFLTIIFLVRLFTEYNALKTEDTQNQLKFSVESDGINLFILNSVKLRWKSIEKFSDGFQNENETKYIQKQKKC